MIIKFRRSNKNQYQWRRWFAWYPIIIKDNEFLHIVWLSFVLTKIDELGQRVYAKIGEGR